MLIYGSEAMLLEKVVIHPHQVTSFQKNLNNKVLREEPKLVPIVRDNAYLKEDIAK